MARKPEIMLKDYLHNKAGSAYEQGLALVAHYLPGVMLHMTLFGLHSFWIPRFKMIWWTISDSCLCTLLHEIGHAKLHPRKFEELKNPWRDYLEEFEAWVWAEETCKRLGIKFDYEYADNAIGFYRKRFGFRRSVQPMWRHDEKG